MYSMYITQISSPPTTQQAKARKKKRLAQSQGAQSQSKLEKNNPTKALAQQEQPCDRAIFKGKWQ